MKNKTHYEARLKRTVKIQNYSLNTYKKGYVISDWTENEFNKFTKKNISNYFIPQEVVGHGNSDYFDMKDIEFIKVETITKTKETKVKLK